MVALTPHLDRMDSAVTKSPVAAAAVAELLSTRPELELDGSRPAQDELVARLSVFWYPDEVVLYIGRAGPRETRPTGGEVTHRVREYYGTPLGARAPHAGGWPLKTLSCLNELSVHYGYCADDREAEENGLGGFAAELSDRTRASLHDRERLMPFANLEFPKGNAKRHGITGAREPAKRAAAGNEGAGEQR